MKTRNVWLISVDGFVTCNLTSGGIEKALKVMRVVSHEHDMSHTVRLHKMGDDGLPHVVATVAGARFLWDD